MNPCPGPVAQDGFSRIRRVSNRACLSAPQPRRRPGSPRVNKNTKMLVCCGDMVAGIKTVGNARFASYRARRVSDECVFSLATNIKLYRYRYILYMVPGRILAVLKAFPGRPNDCPPGNCRDWRQTGTVVSRGFDALGGTRAFRTCISQFAQQVQ